MIPANPNGIVDKVLFAESLAKAFSVSKTEQLKVETPKLNILILQNTKL